MTVKLDNADLGKASRKAAAAALSAHVQVVKGTPLRQALSDALAEAKGLGGQERHFAAFAVRELSRHLRWLDAWGRAYGCPPSSFHLKEDAAIIRYAIWRKHRLAAAPVQILAELKLPGPVRPRSLPDAALQKLLDAPTPEFPLPEEPVERAAAVHSFPNWLAARLATEVDATQLEPLLAALNHESALALRVRPPLRREAVLASLRAQGVEAELLDEANQAIWVPNGRRAVFESREMKVGLLQVMDAGSQRLAALCAPAEGAKVVDYCAGAGGKTIALADAVGPAGRVYASDLSKRRLEDAQTRVRMLKLTHVSFPSELPVETADCVLVDAPCSGAGTLAREPDQKWKLSEKTIAERTVSQTEILNKLAPRLKRGAVLVYGTCSILRAENEEIVDAFLKRHPTFGRTQPDLRVWPHQSVGGGYYGARLVKG
ncbi:MAG: class I SAM-dependent methyltransferase [Myxococcaceae bacterium]|nr:class I SAM-dependent methyltransferase [Myxococcaceae bacterium]